MTTALALVPTTVGEMELLSTKLAQSSLLPVALRGKPADVMVIVMTGAELGLSPMQAVRSISVINGKPIMDATLIVALCKRHPDCEYFQLIESTAESATYETKRAGNPKPTRLTYSMEDARRAGLANRDTYRAHPAPMLRARCSSALGKIEYPDAVLNVLTPDEAQEITERELRAVPAPVGAIDVAAEVVPDARPVTYVPTPEDEAARAKEIADDKATAGEDADTLRSVVADLIGKGDEHKEARRAWYHANHCAARSNSKNPIDRFLGLPGRERQCIISVARKELEAKTGTGSSALPDWAGGDATTAQVLAYAAELMDKGVAVDKLDEIGRMAVTPDTKLVYLTKLDPELQSKP